jgi:hypothetical protein
MRIPFGRRYLDPRRVNNFVDTCAFDPKDEESEAAMSIRTLSHEGVIRLVLAHSNQKEIEHPNTPLDVKKEASSIIYSIITELTPDEIDQKKRIHVLLTGNGKPEKYEADAAHVFEAGKYGAYFITADDRILKNRQELQRICAAMIVTPNEWLKIFQETSIT